MSAVIPISFPLMPSAKGRNFPRPGKSDIDDRMNRTRLFVFWALVSLPAFLVSAYLTGRAGACLKSEAAPWGILSFEVPWSEAEAQRILASWSGLRCGHQTGLEAALRSIQADYAFIPAYCVFLSLLLLLLTPANFVSHRMWLTILWISGLLDIVENLLMSRALQAFPEVAQPAWTYSLASTLKWLGAAVVAGFLLFRLLIKFFTAVKNMRRSGG